MKDDDI